MPQKLIAKESVISMEVSDQQQFPLSSQVLIHKYLMVYLTVGITSGESWSLPFRNSKLSEVDKQNELFPYERELYYK